MLVQGRNSIHTCTARTTYLHIKFSDKELMSYTTGCLKANFTVSWLREMEGFKFLPEVRPLLQHSCAILSSFKIGIIFNITSAEIKTKSADVLLKIITILIELRYCVLKMNGL